MNRAGVKRRVAEIARLAEVECNSEEAHVAQDTLWQDVLTEIAHGHHPSDAAQLAEAALETTKLRFERWYA